MITVLASFALLQPAPPAQQEPTQRSRERQHVTRTVAPPPAVRPTAAAPGFPAAASAFCADALIDQANPNLCIQASSTPTLGMLFPLSSALFVSPQSRVGINSTAPDHALDVGGDARVSQRIAVGNDATIGLHGDYDKLFDMSGTITDFSSSANWDPFASFITVDSPVDLGSFSLYSHDLILEVAAGNSSDYGYLQGPYLAAWHSGTGTVGVLSGAGVITQVLGGGTVEDQLGLYVYSGTSAGGNITTNAGIRVQTGQEGGGGGITDNYGVAIVSPVADGPITNHYGLYLEDQDFGLVDSYAIYAENGDSYLGGDLTIDGDIVVTGNKNFVIPHPTDESKEIRFVCLEGNEAGTYFRGSAQLRDGIAVINVPEEFRLVSEADGLTVQLTPIGRNAGLWVEAQSLERIVVRGERDVSFSYLVNGVRSGYAGFSAIRSR